MGGKTMNEDNEKKTADSAEKEKQGGGPEQQASSAYSDASYTRAPENGQQNYGYNPSYSYNPGNSAAPPQPGPNPPKKKEKKRVSVGALIAICLACVILASALGVGAAFLYFKARGNQTSDTAAQATVTPSATTKQTGSNSSGNTSGSGNYTAPDLTLKSAQDASAMSAQDIYTLACQEVVGISSEVTGYNVFGQSVPESVSGSGVIISDDGFILTNYHVIEDAYEGSYDISVYTYDGTKYTAKVVGVDGESDIAVLKIDATGLAPATLGSSDEMAVGQAIYVVGNPLGELTYTMTTGSVSALDRSITIGTDVTLNMFQIDAAVNEGNSGGPVYNQYGQVIGIVTAKCSSTGVEGLGFAIPIFDASAVADQLITNGYVSGRAYMGVEVTTVSSSVAQYYNMVEGAFVNSVTSGGAADKAGLKPGDIITAIDSTAIKSSSDLTAAVKSRHAGDTATLTVYRSGSSITLSITFDEESSTDSQTSTQSGQSGTQATPNNGTSSNDIQDFYDYFSNFMPGSGSGG